MSEEQTKKEFKPKAIFECGTVFDLETSRLGYGRHLLWHTSHENTILFGKGLNRSHVLTLFPKATIPPDAKIFARLNSDQYSCLADHEPACKEIPHFTKSSIEFDIEKQYMNVGTECTDTWIVDGNEVAVHYTRSEWGDDAEDVWKKGSRDEAERVMKAILQMEEITCETALFEMFCGYDKPHEGLGKRLDTDAAGAEKK